MTNDKQKLGLKGPVKSMHVLTAALRKQNEASTEQSVSRQMMTFDQNGWLIGQVHCNPDDSVWWIAHDYPSRGKLIGIRFYETEGVLTKEVKFIYDEMDRLVAERHLFSDGTVTTHDVLV
jgi:hypothetical protein